MGGQASDAMAQRFSMELHATRGIAAIGVVGYHSLLTFKVNGLDDAHALPFSWHAAGLFQWLLLAFNGQALVTLFFVLSGTVLAMSLQRNPPSGARMLLAYAVKRVFRLFPLLAVAALLAAALFVLTPSPESDQTTRWVSLHHKISVSALPTELLLNIIGARSSLNSAAWSIKVEFLASLLFPAIFWISRRPVATGATAAALAIILFVPHDPARSAYLADFALAFLLGSFLAEGGTARLRRSADLPKALRVATFIAGLALLCATRRIFNPWDFVPSHVIFFETIGAVLIVSVLLSRPRKLPDDLRLFRRLGDLSFGIYLLHVPILTALTPLIAPIARTSGWLAGCAALFAATLGIAIPLALIAFTCVERPATRIGRLLAMWICAADRGARRIGPIAVQQP